MTSGRAASVTVVLYLIGTMAGCGPAAGGRQEISGTIKLGGKALDNGTIDFTPLAEDGRTREGATIIDGKYRIERVHGLAPGKYRVVITAGDGRTPAATPDAAPGPTGANIVSKDRVPPEFNANSKVEVEVTTKGPNVFDFDIPSASGKSG